MSDIDQAALEAAISTAIEKGFNNIRGELGSDTDTPAPPPAELDLGGTDTPRPDPSVTNFEADADKTVNKAKSATNSITSVTGMAAGMLSESAKDLVDYTAAMNDELNKELFLLRNVQNVYGGVTDAAFRSGEALEGIAGQALETNTHLTEVGAGGKEATLAITSGALEGKNALVALFKDPLEPANMFNAVLMDLAGTNTRVAQSLGELGAEEAERIAVIRKRMRISADDMADVLRRQYAFTGEASAEIFEDIAATSVALSKQTGVAAEALKQDILAITKDVDMFGDIGVDSAGRIAAAINELGVDFNTFKQMTSQFMDFDNAANKMGELSALFGIQMDAMEMTYLANEDQEEFLFRMREEILDSGVDVENMSKTRARALAGQLNMSVVQMKTFLKEGELATSQLEMTQATTAAEDMDGLTAAVENFGGAFEGAEKTVDDFQKAVRLQALVPVQKEIAKTKKAMEDLSFAIKPVVSDEAIQNARDMLSAEQAAYTAALPVLEGTVELFNKVNKEGAGVANELIEILKGMTDSEVQVSQEHNVKVEVDDQTKERLEGINNEVQTSNENQAQRDQNVDNLVGQLAQSDISIQELAGLIKEGKQVKIDFNMNAKQMANTLFDVYQAENGLLTIVPADQ